ncbi:phosphoheptose isomerase [Flavobacteriaceae bacterium AU392]|nr:phosphoheptose isomerase [Flavobacteriaceae bacterium]RKM85684.1 phosphoheptose isomerase [Flavobacteriaceae bacterium AU392]
MSKKDVNKLLQDKIVDGEKISPMLPENVKNYLIDIDGTIGEDIPNEEPERMLTAEVYSDALITCNKWYDQGHIICFFTSRTEDHREYTEIWLKKHGFKYHSLLMGKPRGGNYHWIDNHLVKATQYKGKFTDLVDKKVTIQVFDDGK